jgi:hypothetical protein
MIDDVHVGVFEDDQSPWLHIEIGQGDYMLEWSLDLGSQWTSFFVMYDKAEYLPGNWVLT